MSDPDRAPTPHETRLQPGDSSLGRALALVRFLRERCPWDARQTPRTLRPYLLEEAHEVAEAIERSDEAGLEAELGDLLLNLAFQIVLAEERGAFDARAVVSALEGKMESRHPHVYGDADEPPDWEATKAAERAAKRRADDARPGSATAGEGEAAHREDPFRGVAAGIEPLSRAARVQERMAGVGFDWDRLAGPLAKVVEECEELAQVAGSQSKRRIGEADAAIEEEVGDLLFAAVNAARIAGAHPANALSGAIRKFEFRCRDMIALAEKRSIDWRSAGLETLDRLWDEVKETTVSRGDPG